ncbi:MAG TPA: oxygenase MpaB family protein [Actinomycetota bacterium]|jgi:uncharacterized protein (DUF2236 family)|nr:oxygenase MpaB family protein [Actinomycetota bacterium]
MDTPTMRRIHRERVLLVGGQRALVLQLAHPMVAAGVADHSDFPRGALERLRRTLDLTLATIFGTATEADEAIASIRRVHERVSGARAGRPYRATDPRLLTWVNATLLETTLVVYERFVRPLSDEDRHTYYEEAKGFGPLYGIPDEATPPTLEAFNEYMKEMIEGDELDATDESSRLVRQVLRPPLPLWWRVPTEGVRLVTLALLPERIRDMFALRAGSAAHLALAGSSTASRVLLPFLPDGLRFFPAARGSA